MLVLSIFPGGGILDYAFECEGFCVVEARDIIMGGDVRRFHPPAGRFDGIIGGDPCQSHSALANLVRAKGLEPSFPDMTGDFERVVNEARPAWFLRENVPNAPDIKPDGYAVRSFMLCNSTLDSGDGTGNEQIRKRRFWFGTRDRECPELRAHIDFALFELPDASCAVGSDEGNFRSKQQAVAGDARSVPVALGGSGKSKVTAVGGHDGTADAINGYRKARDKVRAAPVTGRHEGADGTPEIDYSPPRRTLEERMRLQGIPADWFEHSPFTMAAKKKIVGNAVAVPTGRQLAMAIRKAMEE